VSAKHSTNGDGKQDGKFAASLYRISEDRQDSIPTQRAWAQRVAGCDGLTVVGEFFVDGERPASGAPSLLHAVDLRPVIHAAGLRPTLLRNGGGLAVHFQDQGAAVVAARLVAVDVGAHVGVDAVDPCLAAHLTPTPLPRGGAEQPAEELDGVTAHVHRHAAADALGQLGGSGSRRGLRVVVEGDGQRRGRRVSRLERGVVGGGVGRQRQRLGLWRGRSAGLAAVGTAKGPAEGRVRNGEEAVAGGGWAADGSGHEGLLRGSSGAGPAGSPVPVAPESPPRAPTAAATRQSVYPNVREPSAAVNRALVARRALARKPEERFPDAERLHQALLPFAGG
jgi:hypothetical protein